MSWTCPNSVCPHEDAAHERSKYYNSDEPRADRGLHQYPLQVSLKTPTGYTPFAQAPSCRDLNDVTQKGLTGKIVAPAAVAAGFCIDVYAISRAGNSFYGDLTRPVLFVEDPRLRGP